MLLLNKGSKEGLREKKKKKERNLVVMIAVSRKHKKTELRM